MFLGFLKELKSFDMYNKIPKPDNMKYVALVGDTSAGKSSIYNWVFHLKLQVGQEEVTDKIEIIFTD